MDSALFFYGHDAFLKLNLLVYRKLDGYNFNTLINGILTICPNQKGCDGLRTDDDEKEPEEQILLVAIDFSDKNYF